MIDALSFDVLTAVFIGTNIYGVEDRKDLNKVAPEGYVLDYEEDPEQFWAGHKLDYFNRNIGEEWVGVSLKRISNDFGEFSFNDVRMYVKAKLAALGINVDFRKIRWHTITVVVECE